MAVILQGALTHINTIGKIDVLQPGDYYVFSAGSGGKHCELNIDRNEMRVIYIWALPDRLMAPPSYHRSHFDRGAHAGQITCLVGKEAGALPIRQDLALYRLACGAGKAHAFASRPGRGVYAFVLEGAAEIGGTRLERRDSIGLTGIDRLDIVAKADATDLLIVDTVL